MANELPNVYLLKLQYNDGRCHWCCSGQNGTPFSTNDIGRAKAEMTRRIKRYQIYDVKITLMEVNPEKGTVTPVFCTSNSGHVTPALAPVLP